MDPSVTLKRREMRKSTYLIDGAWKKLFGNKPNRSDPFEPLIPPAGLVPKVLAVFAAIVVFLPWMLGVLTSFMTQLFLNIPNYAQ